MCYGIAGTIDDKMRVRSQFTSSHDEEGNKPDEDRRTYWEWETYYPFKTVMFTNIYEVGEPQHGMKKAVENFLKRNRTKIALAMLEHGTTLMSRSKNNDLHFQGSRNNDLRFSESKNRDLDFSGSENGDLDFSVSKNRDLCLRRARTKRIYIYNLKTSDKKLNKLIKQFSEVRYDDDATLSNFVKWLMEKKRK